MKSNANFKLLIQLILLLRLQKTVLDCGITERYYLSEYVIMKLLAFVTLLLLCFTSCENTIVTEYDTVKAKKMILINEDGKEFLLTVDKKGVLQIKEFVVD